MKIGIDLDEILVEFIPNLISFHNETYGTSLTRDQFKSPNFWEVWGGTREEAPKTERVFYMTQHFRGIQPIDGAQEGVATLRQDHELIVVTSRPKDIETATRTWLNTYFPDKFSDVRFADSNSENPVSPKSKICSELGIRILIEDRLDNAVECATNGLKVLMLDKPWNQGELPPKVLRVYSWKEIIESIRTASNI